MAKANSAAGIEAQLDRAVSSVAAYSRRSLSRVRLPRAVIRGLARNKSATITLTTIPIIRNATGRLRDMPMINLGTAMNSGAAMTAAAINNAGDGVAKFR